MSQIWIIMYFSDAFQIEEISINKNDYELLKFLTVACMCFCSKRELLLKSIVKDEDIEVKYNQVRLWEIFKSIDRAKEHAKRYIREDI